MKTLILFLTVLISVSLTSCVSTSFFQVYKATPSDQLVMKDNSIVYEDDNCKVTYNLWSNGGDSGFQFFNKTDKTIYLNLEESFFIINGLSYNYYRNRIFTNSKSAAATTSNYITTSTSVTGLNFLDLAQTDKISETNSADLITASGYSVAYTEEKNVCIPSKTFKIISEYTINESLFRDCDLFKFPTRKQITTKSFTKEQSPLVFSNRIAYSVGKNDNLIKFENEFYVTEISNYPENEFIEWKYEKYCGQESMYMKEFFKNVSADKFYIKYSRGQLDDWKH